MYYLLQLATLSDRRPQERLNLLRLRDTREVENLSQSDEISKVNLIELSPLWLY